MLNLLADLQAARGLTYVLVSHDLGVVRHSADRVCVMFLGRVCEVGPTEALFTAPRHPYTRFLLDSVPRPDPTRRGRGGNCCQGRFPALSPPPSGCRFRTRCPYAAPVCAQAPPAPSGNRGTPGSLSRSPRGGIRRDFMPFVDLHCDTIARLLACRRAGLPGQLRPGKGPMLP